MLTENVDNPLLSGLFDRLFAAESEEAVDNGFKELRRLSDFYAGKMAAAEAKERAEVGIARTETSDTMAQVAEEWGMVIETAEGDE